MSKIGKNGWFCIKSVEKCWKLSNIEGILERKFEKSSNSFDVSVPIKKNGGKVTTKDFWQRLPKKFVESFVVTKIHGI